VGGKEVNEMIDEFFDKHLKGGAKPKKPNPPLNPPGKPAE
jgi:hypothetical protein